MKSQNLDDITILATQRCFTSKVDVDIFKSGNGYKFQLTVYRNSKKHVKRLSYEKGKVVIKDQEGKKLETIEAPKQVNKPVSKTVEKDTKPEKV